VTACHTLLVLEALGLPPGRLFPGSYSQWSHTDRPVERSPRLMVRRADPRDAPVVAALLHDFNLEFETPTPGVEVLAGRLEVLLRGDRTIALLGRETAARGALATTRAH